MPKEEILPSRLASLIDALFEAHADPSTLYSGIITQLGRAQLAAAQKRIKKHLQQKGEISTEAAMLVACVLFRTGFPPHRILHFLSLYVRGTVTLSLFELVVTAIFGNTPPFPSSLLYDLTQYTYLEKRLLARKSLEISDALRDSLSPGMLLYLYLLSLRDDLSNENVQLVALIMKNCFPALEVRTRLGGASLEEYGEIARAWRKAEEASIASERARGARAARKAAGSFDRDSASFFLDKYFSDAALEKMRAAAPATVVPIPRPRVDASTAPSLPLPREAAAPSTLDAAGPARARPAREPKSGPPASRGTPAAGQPLAARPVPRQREPGPEKPRRAEAPAAGRRPKPAPRPKQAAPAPPQAPPDFTGARSPRFVRFIIPRIPSIAAAVIVAAGLLGLRVLSWQSPPAEIPHRDAAPAAPSAQQAAAGPSMTAGQSAAPNASMMTSTPAADTHTSSNAMAATGSATEGASSTAPTVTYVVKEGDSLWRIFAALQKGLPQQKGWTDFLSNASKLNNLQDPNRIHTGSTLTLTAPEK